MQIFQQEISDGLEEKIKATASICFAAELSPSSYDHSKTARKNYKSIASYDDKDLYYADSILVSSSWNKNDDIFDRAEVWLAKNTPEDKPTNLDHDESIIVGHIISNIPINDDGEIIPEDTPIDQLPDKYHILTGSVIYKSFSSPELRTRSEKLISEIESGEKYVSMECLFRGFDYGILDSDGNYKVLARDNNTAYLTKYLRAYGGAGQHENYKIGRVLRQITFTGKGFVDKPANPDSVILSMTKQKSISLNKTGVFIDQSNLNAANNTMSLDKEVAELKTKVENMSDCSKAVQDAYASATEAKNEVADLKARLQANETLVSEKQVTIDSLVAEKEEAAKKMSEEMMKKEEEMKKMKAELDAATETIAAYKNKEAEMMKKEKKMKRMASLVELGTASDVAETTVDKFENLDDDSFAAMTTLLAAKKPDWMTKKEEKKEKEKASEQADTSVLDNVEVEDDTSLSVGSDIEQEAIANTRSELVEFVCARLGKKLNKGE